VTTPPRPLETAVSRILRAGVLAALLASIAGALLHFLHHPADRVSFATFTGVDPALASPIAILRRAARADGLALMQLAVLILIATPVVRVLASLVTFAILRDRLFTLASLLVLLMLALGLGGVLPLPP
jgi:uncharacterized membrane protein